MEEDAALVELHPGARGRHPLIAAGLLVLGDLKPLERLFGLLREFVDDTLEDGTVAWPLGVFTISGFPLTGVLAPEHACAGPWMLKLEDAV